MYTLPYFLTGIFRLMKVLSFIHLSIFIDFYGFPFKEEDISSAFKRNIVNGPVLKVYELVAYMWLGTELNITCARWIWTLWNAVSSRLLGFQEQRPSRDGTLDSSAVSSFPMLDIGPQPIPDLADPWCPLITNIASTKCLGWGVLMTSGTGVKID